MCIPHALLRSTKNKQYSPGSSSGRQKNSTQISIFIVYKAYVSAARIVFVPLVSALRARYNKFQLEHQTDLFQFSEFHGIGFPTT